MCSSDLSSATAAASSPRSSAPRARPYLARALPGILPPLSPAESLEVSKIYSIAGLLPRDRTLVVTRPFRAPHHTAGHAGRVDHCMSRLLEVTHREFDAR